MPSTLPENVPRERRTNGILVVLNILAGAWVVYLWILPPSSDFHSKFDAAKWRTGSVLDRGKMVHDLRSKNRLMGLNRTQLLKLLGPPDTSGDVSISYRVDLGHRFFAEPWLYTLVIGFDEDGKVDALSLLD